MFLIIHLVITSYMMGLCWFVQLTHYPIFKLLDDNQISTLDRKHFFPTMIATLPVMTFEMVTALLLLMEFHSSLLSIVNLITVVLLWISTFGLQVPLHFKIINLKNKTYINLLIKTNWIRTILWTLRVLGLIGWVEKMYLL